MTSAIFGFAAATISTLLLWAQQRFVFKLRRAARAKSASHPLSKSLTLRRGERVNLERENPRTTKRRGSLRLRAIPISDHNRN